MADKKKGTGGLSKEDEALWRAFTGEESVPDMIVAPEDFGALLDAFEAGVLEKEKPAVKAEPLPAKISREAGFTQPAQLDGGILKKLQRGQITVDLRIDLHGLTQRQAYAALTVFFAKAVADDKRCVLVITGKGTPRDTSRSLAESEPGVLRTNVPLWLAHAPFNQYVLASCPAQPRDGGHGALYVYLKRQP